MAFVDGFETGSLSAAYSYQNAMFNASIVTTPTPPAGCGTYSLKGETIDGATSVHYQIYRTDVAFYPPITFEFYMSRSTTAHNCGIMFGGTDVSNCYVLNMGHNTTKSWLNFQYAISGAWTKIWTEDTTLGGTIYNNSSSRWIKFVVDWAANGAWTINVYNDASTLLGTKTATDTTYSGGDFLAWTIADSDIFASTCTHYFDAVPWSGGTNATVYDTMKTASGIFLTPTIYKTIGTPTLSGTTESNYVHLTWT